MNSSKLYLAGLIKKIIFISCEPWVLSLKPLVGKSVKTLRRAVYVLNPLPARAVAKQKKNCALVVNTDARDASLR